MSMFVSLKWQRVALLTCWRAWCEHFSTDISPFWITEQISVGKCAHQGTSLRGERQTSFKTVTWTKQTWTKQTCTVSDTPRSHHSAVYDTPTSYFALYCPTVSYHHRVDTSWCIITFTWGVRYNAKSPFCGVSYTSKSPFCGVWYITQLPFHCVFDTKKLRHCWVTICIVS